MHRGWIKGLRAADTKAVRAAQSAMEWIRKIVVERPGTAVSLLAATVSVMGLLYQHSLLRRFGINILDYAELADFALALARHDALMIALVIIVGALLFRSLFSDETSIAVRWIVSAATVGIAVFGYRDIIEAEVESITGLQSALVTVEYSADGRESRELPRCRVISATASYLFLYDRETKRAIAIPKSAVTRIAYQS